MPRKPGPTFADLLNPEDPWVELATSDNHRTARTLAFTRLRDLGVPLPPHPTARDVRAAGIKDEDFRLDLRYRGPRLGRCDVVLLIRRSVLNQARGPGSPDAQG